MSQGSHTKVTASDELVLSRRFTTAGRHPYDDVEWELRDAVIRNYRTGQVAFEQKDVEIPKKWSQNATNIAAQKYFRGSPGTPRRERSVKQMIDRVANRYTEEGLGRGYFRDEAEALVFQDELMHLLVTQKAAFNSPVWFNVGWRPKGEEQVSACQPYHSLVSTPAGLVPIGKLVEDNAVGTKVYDAEGVTSVVAVKANGVREVLRIHTKAGHTLDVTADHLVWKKTGERSGRFVAAGELGAGDALEWHRRDSFGDSEIDPAEIHAAALTGRMWNTAAPPEDHFLTAPLPVVASYLRGLFGAQGSISFGEGAARIGVGRIAEDSARALQRLLLRFGICASLRPEPKGRPEAWSLDIESLGDRRIFADEIDFIDPIKRAKLEHSLTLDGVPSRSTKQLEIERIEVLGEMDVFDIQTESGEYLSANLRVHNCFILSVEDEMSSILNWYVEEGTIFKHGSGSGLNLSKLRSSKEHLRSGGTASGPVSFMRGADASAGTIKSGGATRRAAKMVVLNVDHPDIKDFIWCKALEERKARALREAGFDMDLDGKDSHSIQYQNANNSVRVTDEFMNAVLEGAEWELKAVTTGETLETLPARDLFRDIAQAAWDCADPGMQYDTTINDWHTCPNSGPITASNPCSEFIHVDNSSCNLASLNLLKFIDEQGHFDIDGYKHAVEIMFLAQEISVGFASYPTDKITDNSHRMRQLGQGYANLGALLMSEGLAYDSDEGRAWAGAITALMTGHCYATSAKIAKRVGAFDAFAQNREPMLRVMNKHRDAAYQIPDALATDDLVQAARRAWDEALEFGHKHGYRNSQATVLAPTGCLVGGSLVPTERGLVRLASLGDPDGAKWQSLGVSVNTDEGSRKATHFYANGSESVVDVETSRGYRIKGTPSHRIKVVEPDGRWVWKRFAELKVEDVVPLSLDQLVGEPQIVPLPPFEDAYWTGEHEGAAPDTMTAELAELLGYFMGDGSLHARGIRLCVDGKDFDVLERLSQLGKEVFGLEAHKRQVGNYVELSFHSVRLVRWWSACGFAKHQPRPDHAGKGRLPHIPNAVLYSNDRSIYAAFLRGLFETDGTVTSGYPCWSTTSVEFSHDVQSLLLALGYPTTRKFDMPGWGENPLAVLRLLNLSYNQAWQEEIGFISDRKNGAMERTEAQQAARKDKIPVTRALLDRLAPARDRVRDAAFVEWRRSGRISRRMASVLYERTADPELGSLLPFFYDTIASAKLSEDELTYDLSVPDNVTYMANGFISHNTIGLLMDCDTTGIEPDLALKKVKKLVGGGTMSIVNQTVPRALRKLGYNDEQIVDIIAYIDENSHVIGAPHLHEEHMDVFDTAMGERSINYLGHLKMMAAAQPFLSGAISKTVNVPEDFSVEDVERVYVEGWRLGIKALALYRDNCKVGQPLSVSKKEDSKTPVASSPEPVRRRLPKKRAGRTFKFRVADTEGYLTTGEFPDGTVGEIFLKVAKQGSTLAGIMDAFAISISMGLQYGVPLSAYVKQFVNTRFEPSGMTDDPDFRIATSILDYVFRLLALDYLEAEDRHRLNIRTSGERQGEIESKLSGDTASGNGNGHSKGGGQGEGVIVLGAVADAHAGSMPFCGTCGVQMQPAGSCFACPSCGSTSGCS